MMSDPRVLIDGYLDDILTAKEHSALSTWIQSDPEHAKIFAHAAMIHDGLRNSLAQSENIPELSLSKSLSRPVSGWFGSTSVWSTAATLAILCLGLGVLWLGFGQSTASAAIRELNRIIVNNISNRDRTYAIVVEQVFAPPPRGNRPPSLESQRPPKPPLDGAVLHVRDGGRFVLIRNTNEGLPFVTGSNGEQSWAVHGNGPVKVSSDIHHFDRDLPGHESSIPLTNLHEGLERIRQAYRVQFSTIGPEEFDVAEGETVRMLVAVKKPMERGPQRIEIVYESTSGRILHMRFVQMPYGPDRLDLRLSMMNEKELPPDFFEHTSHHAPDRNVEREN